MKSESFHVSWYSCGCASKTDTEENKLLNKVIIFVFYLHKKYSRVINFGWTTDVTWTILSMSLQPFWALNMLVPLQSSLLKIKELHDAIEEPFLSKWFNKEPLTSEEPFCLTKCSLWRNKVLQIIIQIWLNGSLWNQKWFSYGISVKNLLSTFIFKSVCRVRKLSDFIKNILICVPKMNVG